MPFSSDKTKTIYFILNKLRFVTKIIKVCMRKRTKLAGFCYNPEFISPNVNFPIIIIITIVYFFNYNNYYDCLFFFIEIVLQLLIY